VLIALNVAFSRKVYADYDEKLKAAEAQLDTINEFERV
jgi:hypothetical protein